MAFGDKYRTIEVDVSSECPVIQGKNIYATSIAPGFLVREVELGTPTSQLHGFIPHSPVRYSSEALFAVENLFEGRGIDTVYEPSEMVRARVCRPGSLVLAWGISNPWVMAVGDILTSNGDGRLAVKDTPDGDPVAAVVGLDPLDSSTIQRILVRIY